jgi:hypothetical protein
VRDTDRLCEAYVVDARFVIGHNLLALNRDLTRALLRDTNFQLSRDLTRALLRDTNFQLSRDLTRALLRDANFQLSHLIGVYYLLMFNSNITHTDFMHICDRQLNTRGYIFFIWTPVVKSNEQASGYKVWLDLTDLLPHF